MMWRCSLALSVYHLYAAWKTFIWVLVVYNVVDFQERHDFISIAAIIVVFLSIV